MYIQNVFFYTFALLINKCLEIVLFSLLFIVNVLSISGHLTSSSQGCVFHLINNYASYHRQRSDHWNLNFSKAQTPLPGSCSFFFFSVCHSSSSGIFCVLWLGFVLPFPARSWMVSQQQPPLLTWKRGSRGPWPGFLAQTRVEVISVCGLTHGALFSQHESAVYSPDILSVNDLVSSD